MTYESVISIDSQIAPGVRYEVQKMSYGRRADLMRRIRELARKQEFLQASEQPGDKMEAALLEAEVNRVYVVWGLKSIAGLTLDGAVATPELLADHGPENLFREALDAVRAQTGLTPSERKN